MEKSKWHSRFLNMCRCVAFWSPDPSTQVGAVIVDDDHNVLTTGYNGFPRGVDTSVESRWERPDKYDWVEHAERNAIFAAARNGVKLLGATMYLPFAAYPCAPCMRAIIQAGIKRLICSDIPFPGKGNKTAYDTDSMIQGEMAEEAGVEIWEIGEAKQLYIDMEGDDGVIH